MRGKTTRFIHKWATSVGKRDNEFKKLWHKFPRLIAGRTGEAKGKRRKIIENSIGKVA